MRRLTAFRKFPRVDRIFTAAGGKAESVPAEVRSIQAKNSLRGAPLSCQHDLCLLLQLDVDVVVIHHASLRCTLTDRHTLRLTDTTDRVTKGDLAENEAKTRKKGNRKRSAVHVTLCQS